jgi:aryl-alcohol dehydrogenase-like predicted oxidoreductase
LLYREDERDLLPLIADQGLASLPWSPLARGYLAGSRGADASESSARAASDPVVGRLYGSDTDHAIVERVKAVAEARGVTPSQVALAWLMSRPGTTIPVIGATKPHHLSDAVAALSLDLTEEEIGELEALYRPRAVAVPR